MIDSETFLKHITDEDYKLKMRILLDKVFSANRDFSVKATDFYDPYEQQLAESILRRFDLLGYSFTNGLDFGEKKICLIYPESRISDLKISDYISVLSIKSQRKMEHGNYLGAVLNQGIAREKIGDLFVSGTGCFLIADFYAAKYLLNNLDKVGKEKVSVERVDFSDVTRDEEPWEEKTFTAASLRIDAVIKEALNISRKDAEDLIYKNKVKLDWKPVREKSQTVSGEELISVRGRGRIKLLDILGETKKGKLRILALFLLHGK